MPGGNPVIAEPGLTPRSPDQVGVPRVRHPFAAQNRVGLGGTQPHRSGGGLGGHREEYTGQNEDRPQGGCDRDPQAPPRGVATGVAG